MMLVAVVLPCADFVGEDFLVGDAAMQTLRRQHGEFGFGHVEPTAVLGRVMPFEAFDEPARLGRRKGLIERGWLVGVEIILHQHDFRRVGKMRVGQIPEHVEDVKPHKVRYYLERRDPDFAEKMAQVLCVYRQVKLLKKTAALSKRNSSDRVAWSSLTTRSQAFRRSLRPPPICRRGPACTRPLPASMN